MIMSGLTPSKTDRPGRSCSTPLWAVTSALGASRRSSISGGSEQLALQTVLERHGVKIRETRKCNCTVQKTKCKFQLRPL